MNRLTTIVTTALLFASCGHVEQITETPSSDQEGLSLSAIKDVFCPVGSSFLASHQMCATASEAVGPFPYKMVVQCQNLGGGSPCAKDRWALEFAKQIRGTGVCPPGTTLDSSVEECSAGDYAYGPFSNKSVAFCKTAGGGASCETQRIAKKHLPVMATTPNLAVPYFFQYSNAYEPGRTCNLTSLAMVLNFHGKATTPDKLYLYADGPVFTGSGVAAVARDYGLNAVYSERGNKELIKRYLDEGKPVILQGWFTNSGHFIVIVGYNASGWIVNDSAGRWNGVAYGSYDSGSSTVGKKIVYSYSKVEAAATDPGNPSSYWITVVSKK